MKMGLFRLKEEVYLHPVLIETTQILDTDKNRKIVNVLSGVDIRECS